MKPSKVTSLEELHDIIGAVCFETKRQVDEAFGLGIIDNSPDMIGLTAEETIRVAEFPIWLWFEDGKQKISSSDSCFMLTNHLNIIREAKLWNEIKSRVWEPNDGQMCWFWNNVNDRVVAYFNGVSTIDGTYRARFTKTYKNGSWTSSFKFCEIYKEGMPT